jgi:hypothetical protein
MDPTQRRVDRDIESSMDLFQQARVGEVSPVEPHPIKRILVGLDGSSQDRFSLEIARGLKQRLSCELHILDAREGETSTDLAREAAQQLGGSAVQRTAGESFHQILKAATECHADLLVIPCPFGRDLEAVGPDSTGTVIDVLLSRSLLPILAVRKPFAQLPEVFDPVYLALTSENDAEHEAARWAVTLVAPRGALTLMLILEDEFAENVRHLLHAMDPDLKYSDEALEKALVRTHVRLHRGLQQAATAQGFRYDLQMHSHEGREELPIYKEAHQPLVVLALESDDPQSQGEVRNRIRFSPNPVLIVRRKQT